MFHVHNNVIAWKYHANIHLFVICEEKKCRKNAVNTKLCGDCMYIVNHLKLYKVQVNLISRVMLSPPSATYIRQWTGSALDQIMACRLVGAKPLSEPMMEYCQFYPQEQTSVKYQSKQAFSFKKMHLKMLFGKCRPFCLILNVLMTCVLSQSRSDLHGGQGHQQAVGALNGQTSPIPANAMPYSLRDDGVTPSRMRSAPQIMRYSSYKTGLILGLCPANERRCYFVMRSLIGLAQASNQPCKMNRAPSQYEDCISRYRHSCHKDETIIFVMDGNSYTSYTAPRYWDRA